MATRILYNGPETKFHLEQAPYIQYLSALGQEVRSFRDDLLSAARLVKREEQTTLRRSPHSSIIAQVLDIEAGPDGKGNAVIRHVGDTLIDNGITVPKPQKVGAFLDQIGDCGSGIHTRVIVLHSDRTSKAGTAVDNLLFCHILGVTLDLPVTTVRTLAGIDTRKDKEPGVSYRLPIQSGFVFLGESGYDRTRGVAAYLGKRQMKGGCPQLVIVRLHPSHGYDYRLPGGSVSRLWEPLVYSQWSAQNPVIGAPLNIVTAFDYALKSRLQSSPALQDDDLTGSWLSAIIHMDIDIRSSRVDYVASRWSNASKSLSTNDLRDLLHQAKQTRSEIKASVNQVVAFVKSYPSVRLADYQHAYDILEDLLEKAEELVEDIKSALDTQHQIKNLEVSSLAVQESKSAIAVTILAFVFIPINLASSVYGMNVQEINETGHSIWGFVVTALVLLACSGLAWLTWRTSIVLRETKWRLPKGIWDSFTDLVGLQQNGTIVA